MYNISQNQRTPSCLGWLMQRDVLPCLVSSYIDVYILKNHCHTCLWLLGKTSCNCFTHHPWGKLYMYNVWNGYSYLFKNHEMLKITKTQTQRKETWPAKQDKTRRHLDKKVSPVFGNTKWLKCNWKYNSQSFWKYSMRAFHLFICFQLVTERRNSQYGN